MSVCEENHWAQCVFVSCKDDGFFGFGDQRDAAVERCSHPSQTLKHTLDIAC